VTIAFQPYNYRVAEDRTRWWLYVESVGRGAQQNEIAARADLDNSLLTRWKKGQAPAPQHVLKFARAYGRNVLEAFVAAEYITDDDAALREVTVGLDSYTDQELSDELLRRLRR
jgi:transcriptional regulator with XRE-family HTH domain